MRHAKLLFVLCYDIACDRRRGRVARRLEKRALRVQKSVFELLATAPDAERFAERLARRLGPGDSLRLYALDKAACRMSRVWGAGPRTTMQDTYLF